MTPELHGPAGWEHDVPRYGPVGRVAVISDVHANVAALTAVLGDIEAHRLVAAGQDLGRDALVGVDRQGQFGGAGAAGGGPWRAGPEAEVH